MSTAAALKDLLDKEFGEDPNIEVEGLFGSLIVANATNDGMGLPERVTLLCAKFCVDHHYTAGVHWSQENGSVMITFTP